MCSSSLTALSVARITSNFFSKLPASWIKTTNSDFLLLVFILLHKTSFMTEIKHFR